MFDKVTALAEWLLRQGKDAASVKMITAIASSAGFSPKTAHRPVAEALGPDVTLAGFIWKFLREGIERHNRQKKGTA